MDSETDKSDESPEESSTPARTGPVFLVLHLHDHEGLSASYGDDVAAGAVKMLADLLRQNIRSGDLIIHKGQGEFVLMLATGPEEEHPDDIVLRRLQLMLDRDLALSVGRERIRIHATIQVYVPEEGTQPFADSPEISIFLRGRR